MAFAVGVDLGTTNTVVGAVKDGVAATVTDANGSRLIPSAVSFHPSGSVLVGYGALERRLMDGANTISSVKRLIGRPWSSPEVQAASGKLPFALKEGAGGSTVVMARNETYALPEISAFVLRQARAVAEAALGEPVERAVITVPANFNDLQRGATKTAGRLAGLEVLRILNEPTAAALAYGPQGKSQERIAVYDLGGGTFDVTVLDLAGNVFEVLATAGDTALGGDDIDVVVAERMADDVLKKHRFDAREQPLAFGRLRILAEEMKRALSSQIEHTLTVTDLVPAPGGAYTPWTFRMTRPELEWASLTLVERTFQVCQRALDAAGVGQKDLDRIILVGGATRMPMVARKSEQFFGRPPVVRINPDEVVALGAAIQAALLDRTKQRATEPMQHPTIAEDSVVREMPEEDGPASSDAFGLPLVGGPSLPAPPNAQPPAPPAPAPSPQRHEPPAPARPPAPAPAPAAPPKTQFLPGRAGSTLVFDVPGLTGTPAGPLAGATRAVPDLPSPNRAANKPAPSPAAQTARILPSDPPPPPRPAPLLIDVTPLSLGVETVGGYCDILIDANTPVPCDRTRSFTTAAAGQTSVQVRVSQGESKRFDENTFLGEVQLSGIPAGARGVAQIAVTFEIDADGILNVRALDVKSGQATAARIQLVGAQNDPRALEAMQARQAAHPLAGIAPAR
ncbi:MAG TPA: Hsp70 family protein [Polyangiaceae bacterium]